MAGKHRLAGRKGAPPYPAFALGGVLLVSLAAGIALAQHEIPRGTPAATGSAPASPGQRSPAEIEVGTTSPTPSASPSPSPSPTPSPPDRYAAVEDEVTQLINKERERAGCRPAQTDERMREAARAHSADMAKHDYFSHEGRDGSSFVDRLSRAGYPRGAALGENIAYGYRSAESVVRGWMDSEGHRNNILNCAARATGVGLAYRGNTPYWTQLFGRS